MSIVIYEGYANSKACQTSFTADAMIQIKCSHTGWNLLSYKNAALH